MEIPKWLPDWRDVSQYPAPDDLTLQGWAWEFLRRNSEYQKDWLTMIPDRGLYVFNDDVNDLRADPETDWQQGDRSALLIDEVYAGKWGMKVAMKNPAEKYSDGCPPFFESYPAPRTLFYAEVNGAPKPSKGSPSNWRELGFIFNLAAPLDQQLDWAKSHMLRRRRHLESEGKIKPFSRRNTPENFPNYLRCFDGKSLKVNYVEMAKVLFGMDEGATDLDPYPYSDGADKAKNFNRAAAKLVRQDYWRIPSVEAPPQNW